MKKPSHSHQKPPDSKDQTMSDARANRPQTRSRGDAGAAARPVTRRAAAEAEAPITAQPRKHQATAAAAIAAAPEPSFAALPAHVRTWPTTYPPTGEKGFADPDNWLQSVGDKLGITTKAVLRDRVADGSIPAVKMKDLGSQMAFVVGGAAGEKLLLAKDPAASQPDPGPLRATAYARIGTAVMAIPTNTTTSLTTEPEAREVSSRQAVAEALGRLPAGTSQPQAVRLAWLAQPDGPQSQSQVRLVEYRFRSGAPIPTPTPAQDLEAAVARQDLTPTYSTETLRSATAARAPAATAGQPRTTFMAPVEDLARPANPAPATSAPMSSATTTTAGIAGTTPREISPPAGVSSPVAAPAAALPTAPITVNTRPYLTAAPAGAGARASTPEDVAMERSRAVEVAALVTATTAHALLVVPSVSKFLSSKAEAGGLVSTHAGIVSNYSQFFLKGDSKTAQMTPGSQIILAERKGDRISVTGFMPYAGVRMGNRPAGQLLGRADLAKALDKPIELSLANDFGGDIPNLPQAISPDSINSGFKLPAQNRRQLWNAIQAGVGWPMPAAPQAE